MNRLLLAFSLALFNVFPLSAQEMPSTATNLVSPTTKLDYTPLKRLLDNQKWREANEKTGELMLKAGNRQLQGWMTTDDILNLACWDLQTIDSLWQEASNNHFGFSVQFPIFIQTGNRPGRLISIEAYEKFGDVVGWRRTEGNTANAQPQWIQFKENINFSLDAPVGHLPQVRQQYNLTGNRLQYTMLTQRLVECKIVSVPSP